MQLNFNLWLQFVAVTQFFLLANCYIGRVDYIPILKLLNNWCKTFVVFHCKTITPPACLKVGAYSSVPVIFVFIYFQIWRNVLVIGFCFLFNATAWKPLQDLQSSLFHEDGMGTTALAVNYTTMILTSLFLAPSIVKVLGMLMIDSQL